MTVLLSRPRWTRPTTINVMYAELADYFYVWEKRTLGRLVPTISTMTPPIK